MSLIGTLFLAVLIGIVLGALFIWAIKKSQISATTQQLNTMQQLYSESDSALRQCRTELAEKAASLFAASTELASVKKECESVAKLTLELSQMSQELETQRNELMKAVQERSTAVAERDSLQKQLGDANDRIARLEDMVREQTERAQVLVKEQAELRSSLEVERNVIPEKLSLLETAESHFKNIFDSLASKVLRDSTEQFLNLADRTLGDRQKAASAELEQKKETIAASLTAAAEQLAELQTQVQTFDKSREIGNARLTEQIRSLVDLQHTLADETRRLSRALEKPMVRGNWGEIQLRRVAELAGMIEYCDFQEQVTIYDEEGKKIRPDMVVMLPNRRSIAVDSKVSLTAFIAAANSDSVEEIRILVEQHTEQIKKHVTDLSSKRYWSQLDKSPDLAVAFIPSEALYSAALQCDPSLLEFAASHRILLATPTTLIALLRAVHYGWREEKLAVSAQEISDIGRMLYKRLVTLQGHLTKLGNSIDSTVEHYNKVIGSLEASAFPAARKFEQLGAATEDELPIMGPVEKAIRPLRGPDWHQPELAGNNPEQEEAAVSAP